ncbi:MAG TPA: phage tail tape measure protein [Fluviicoccus sp.]|nr:phage tail tape measure protein [Fluviicoccus sp.]
MANVLSRMQILLEADTANFQQDLGKAGNTAKEQFDKMVDSAKSMAIAVAGAFTIDAIAGFVNDAINAAVELDNLSHAVGISSQQMQRLQFATQMTGVDAGRLGDAFGGLNEKILEAATQGGESADTFKALGINVKDAQGNVKSADQVFREMADAMAGMEDGATKSAIASNLMGDAGAELIPVLNLGAAGLDDLGQKAEQYGIVQGPEAVQSARELKQAMTLMQGQLQGAANTLAASLLPLMRDMAGDTTAAADRMNAGTTAAEGFGNAIKGLYIVVRTAWIGLQALSDVVAKVLAARDQFLEGNFSDAKNILLDGTALNAYKDEWVNMVQTVTETGGQAVEVVKKQEEQIKRTGAAAAAARALAAGGDDKKGKGDKDASAIDQIRGGLMSPEDRETAQYEKQRRLLETANASAFESADERHRLLEQLEQQHIGRINELKDKERQTQERIEEEARKKWMNEILDGPLVADIEFEASQKRIAYEESQKAAEEAEEQKRKQMGMTKDFFLGGLDQMAQGQGKAAKAAQAIQKAQALQQIAINTHSAAIGAYNALAPIPFVGPALGVAAAAAAIAFGANMARGVMSGGQPSAPSSAPSAPTGSAAVQPISEQQPGRTQQTILQIPANSLMTGRMIADLLDDALGDGKQLTNLRVQAV